MATQNQISYLRRIVKTLETKNITEMPHEWVRKSFYGSVKALKLSGLIDYTAEGNIVVTDRGLEVSKTQPTYNEEFSKVHEESKAVGEKNDCAVKAVAIATGAEYKTAHETLRKLGRRNGKSTDRQITLYAVKQLGYNVQDVTYSFNHVKTVRSFEDVISSDQIFLVATYRHILAVKDGKVQDWTEGRLHRIKNVYLLTPSQEKEETMSAKKTATKTSKKATKSTKKSSSKKATKSTKKAAPKATAKKTETKPAEKKDKGFNWTDKRTAIVKALVALGATSSSSARSREEIAKKAGAGIEEKDVQHYLYKDNDLVTNGFTGVTKMEGNRTNYYYATAKGAKAVK